MDSRVIIIAFISLGLLLIISIDLDRWSIGIYTGSSPFELADPGISPVIRAEDVSDIEAGFVADPFMLQENGTWYMFFEAFNTESEEGDIGLAVSGNGFEWEYQGIVLDEPFHLSYPYVFRWKGEHYLIPESYEADSIRLYKADRFPYGWSFVDTLLEGMDYKDNSIFRYDGMWWMFTTDRNDMLYLYYANELEGEWQEHPMSPVVEGNGNKARPGGRVIMFNGSLIRYAQDDFPVYGNKVNAFEITVISPEDYQETPVKANPILSGNDGWNRWGMHHIDAHQLGQGWIAAVDGH